MAPGAIGADDLAASAHPKHFAYSGAIDTAQETVLDFDGYKISAECENGSGQPRLVANMTVPEAGALDQLLTIGAINAGAPETAQS